MKVVLFGATGMVGQGVLQVCLADDSVREVALIVRHATGVQNPKVREFVHADFFDFTSLQDRLTDYDACFFCLGTSAVGMSEQDYRHVTYDLTLAAAKTLVAKNPRMTFIYVSGASTDENGRMMWARVKGQTESALLRLGFKDAYMFRPGYIHPMRGVVSKTGWYRLAYAILSPLYPLLKLLIPSKVTTSENVGRAMLRLAAHGSEKKIIENGDINEAGAA